MTNIAPPTPGVQLVEVAPELAGQRIDNFLITYLKGVPKTLIYRILRKGEVRVN
ncbi:23S rRNA pseudouridine(955/2504/2580) synthase, partial [Pseudomonas syringae]|nr:23S rRNA pseudouridine(955/2504/2580) synthase [Pseudomonas syringae]